MKTIGLLGGMSWESTVVYYQHLNQNVRERLGNLHSAKLLLWSCDFAEIEALQAAGDWESAGNILASAAKNLEVGGADCIVICTNTMHKLATQIEAAIDIPLIHIADATATAIKRSGVKKPLLLATRYTMEQDFYKGYLLEKHNIQVAIPNQSARETVHSIIYNELCRGIVQQKSKNDYLTIIAQSDADSVILGCTEVGLLINAADVNIPVFDTTELHALAALDFALS